MRTEAAAEPAQGLKLPGAEHGCSHTHAHTYTRVHVHAHSTCVHTVYKCTRTSRRVCTDMHTRVHKCEPNQKV
jgi:hypothetical protein